MPEFPDVIVTVLLGFVLGSFATAVSMRELDGRSWVADKGGGAARSACPSCGAALGIFDLIPLLSWLCLRGRCRHCKKPIGWMYPLMELTVLALCLANLLTWGMTLKGTILMLAVPFFVALSYVDLRRMILPDRLVAIVGGLGYGFAVATSHALSVSVFLMPLAAASLYAAVAAIMGFGIEKLLKKPALGLGDVKFFAAAGIWLGMAVLPYFLMGAGGAGIILGLGWRLAGRGMVFPFGPALIVALLGLLFWQGAIHN